MKKISYFSVALLLTACGGGSESDNKSISSNTSTVITPTLSITLSQSTFMEGDRVTVSWASTNANTCQASGLISGTLEVSGKKDIVLTNVGTSEINITCNNGARSVSEKVSLNVIEKPYFTEIKNALTTSQPFFTTLYFAVTPLDINNDGNDDLVVHMWSWENFNKYVGNIPCSEEVRIFIYQNDDTFSEQTSSYLPNGNKLNGCSRKIKIGDINGDGKLDIVYALNQEDTRLDAGNNMYYIEAHLGALVSTGNFYTIKNFGDKAWYHAVGIGRDEDGRAYVVGAGYSRLVYDKHYFDRNANVTSVKRDKPKLAPNNFILYNPNGGDLHSTHLIQEQGHFEVEGHIKVNNKWQNAGKINVLELFKVVRHCPDFTDCHDVSVFKYKDKLFTGGYNESCTIKMNPNGKEIAVLQGTGGVVDFDGDKINYNPPGGGPIAFFKAFTINNSKIEEVALNIKNEQFANINSNFIDCKDINNDGYMDLVRYPYNESGLPFIFLNDKNGGFEYIGQNQFPDTKNDWQTNATSLLHDFNKDGMMDLLVWPGTPMTGKENVTFQFYKGNKNLK